MSAIAPATQASASHRICPVSMAAANGPRPCIGPTCMAWVWVGGDADYEKHAGPYPPVTKAPEAQWEPQTVNTYRSGAVGPEHVKDHTGQLLWRRLKPVQDRPGLCAMVPPPGGGQ